MNTQLKNEWITSEEKYHKLLKEKVTQHNLNNSSTPLHPDILSQMTFCSDGVIIKKHNDPNFKSGISFKVSSLSIAGMKSSERYSNEMNDFNILFSPIYEYKIGEISKYSIEKIAERDFKKIVSVKY